MPARSQLLKNAATCLVALTAALGVAAPAAHADSNLESMFQDDNQLIFNTPDGTRSAMDTLQLLGVDRIRVSVFWKQIAPDPDAPTMPAFDASNPAAYSQAAWDKYDQIVKLAQERHIAVNFNVTSPAPNWATGTPDRPELDKTFDPNRKEFGDFVHALGVRYDGNYLVGGVALPKVRYWSIWNEPNQGGWLTPQWSRDPRGKNAWVETSPIIYRGLVDNAWTALQSTGHAGDTILIGDTAPKGLNVKGESRPIAALRFLRQLYCLDDHLQAYKGTSAQIRSCPVGPNALADFPAQHPALFQATGYATHPYELFFSPHTRPTGTDAVTIANLDDMERILRRIYQRYRQPLPKKGKDVPLYLTEFGYQTDPPDPTGVTPGQQAAYDNEAEYRAYRSRYVKTLSQFLLVDDKPVPGKDPFGSTFQTGLMTAAGVKKPSYAAYAMAIYLPKRVVGKSRRLQIWGTPRVAPAGKAVRVTVEYRTKKGKKYRRLGSLKTKGRRHYILHTIGVPGSGAVRLAWKDATGHVWRSRSVAFSVRR
ncbi:cellulase family glycosylhydrolase [Paraconexibacter antarcticus]|uniref:Cellulase family glycosylhydrolase n=1 Tax=Paraconexibacter antarcticus TaxID=2949664 RepID=A0ABY5DVZ4_9ACTN|nr:cellulase family glycosylhydrolase [Paraconexibacter antarcticus]UTI65027.1 cellulase family glycosylhydrolase [Paraconexibacter antarcticus]